jgi:hypothetical protein
MRAAVIVPVLLIGLCAPPAAADTSLASSGATTIRGYKETVKTTVEGTKHRNKVRVLGGAPRLVEIQYSSDGTTWVTRKTRTTDEIGRLRFVVKVKPDRNRWRLNVPATASYSGATSSIKTFAVQLKEPSTPSVPIPPITTDQITASKAYARSYMLKTYGWGDDQWFALEQLWIRESGWNHLAVNPSSGATGIPQALPGDKMASAGADWKTNPQTQIRWGLSYIKERYKTPAGAWQEFLRKGWY